MIYEATNIISEALEDANLNNHVVEADEFSYVELGFATNSCNFQLRFISSDDKEVKAVTSDFAKIPKEKSAIGFEVVNELNSKFKIAKFHMDTDDGGVSAQFDVPMSAMDNIGAVAVEISLRFMNIIENAYPDIMRAIWS